jgi:hypothetical protein
MKRQLLVLCILTGALVCAPMKSADAQRFRGSPAHGIRGRSVGHGVGLGRGFGPGFGRGFGFGGFFIDEDGDLAELYRELLNNVPYFALHPPVYYSYPVPRTYGYSPFAYPPGVMTPDVLMDPEPLEIINPHVPSTKTDGPAKEAETTAAVRQQPQPLVVLNPYVTAETLARAGQ